MTPSFAFLFPGQGSQYVGMGKALVERYESAAETYKLADSILGFAISDLCFHGPELELNDTANAQLAILVTSVAAYNVLQELLKGIDQSYAVAGHSLGEYSALIASGALDFISALSLVRARGEAMREAGEILPGGMLVVMRAMRSQVEDLCKLVSKDTGKVIQIANDNCPGQIVIAGEIEALETFTQNCKSHGIRKPQPLKVSVAPHTSLMEEALPKFLKMLAASQLKNPVIPIIGNVNAKWLSTNDEVREELKKQLVEPVLWNDSMRCLINSGVKSVVEVGPGKVLNGLMRRIDKRVKRANFGDDQLDLTSVLDILSMC